MIKIFDSSMCLRLIYVFGLLFCSGCVVTQDAVMEFDVEIELEDCSSDFGDGITFLVTDTQQLSSINGFALYHDILSEHGINAYVIPKRLCEDAKYSSLLGGLSVVYPQIEQSQVSLKGVDLTEFKKSVFPQILRYMARDESRYGVNDCGFELHRMASSPCELDLARRNAALEDALEGILLCQRFPNLGRVYERIDCRESRRFSNSRGGCPFSNYSDAISEIKYSFFDQEGRKFGSVKIVLPWNYYVDLNIGSGMGIKDVQKTAMREFVRLLCDNGQRRSKYVGVIRRIAKGETCELIWNEE